jgi:tRNA dimethylallyltransferase
MRAELVIVLVGPTASGKTALLDRLFGTRASRQAFGLPEAEIVSADSMQAYRGMDIGTAKPDAALRSRLPHRLIDMLDPAEQYTAGDFVRLADEACHSIAAAGRLPIVCGGSGFYARNFICGLPTAPAADPRTRERVASELAADGADALREELAARDPESAARIHANDLYRLTRAIEIVRTTGGPMAAFAASLSPRRLFRFAVFGVELPREELGARIDERVDAMMAAGLPSEVAVLRAAGASPMDPGMAAIGYREFFEAGRSLPEVAEAIKRDTRRYAKRQMTFFRKLPGIEWIPPDAEILASRLHSILGGGDGPAIAQAGPSAV